MKIYGIHNCDTVKKAKRYFDEHGIKYEYHDFRKDGFPDDVVEAALKALGTDTLVNKRSTTWKQMSDEEKAQLVESPLESLRLHATLIKRPLIYLNNQFSVGFKPQEWSK